ncbi:HAD-IIIC family phosphatase [Campylobacter insulaenigrae]|uniref:HAD-IIIC family phosphatase n=1 Tax=Campylobacter insulaenigrae TaxID=260714 RepID=UPI002152CA09|nr:HAD-IIIC family phosphatase [Campylobacter insulaenigrae]MCR6575147.1 HAD-IIIC family phosphatase [Campylobacter insulaenigrae]MCR6584299.1 HAD-IIIC family phosphatase [Campylobacter insulaenigrae]
MNLFSSKLKRNELIKLSKENTFESININVFRNHSFEPCESIINAFLAFSNLRANFNLSSYDDSLSFNSHKNADINIIFIDLNNYKNNIDDILEEKIEELKNLNPAPIITLLLGNTKLKKYDLSQILSLKQDELLDERNFELSASRLSSKAFVKLAQVLGLSIIPSLLKPNLKAIIVDLDNTLYDGILGEDGIDNLKLNSNHINLQNELQKLKNQGFLLAIASKNNEEDVKKLFSHRSDFILNLDDFSYIKANWQSKDENIKEIVNFFNIGFDSVLFIDDNIAEIENTKYLGIKTLLADNESSLALKLYPGLFKTKTNEEDKLRSADIKANIERKNLAKLNQKEYFLNLKIKLTFNINQNLQRCCELLNKTNQFIANYSRMDLIQCENFAKENFILSIQMSDKLSDSGIIAVIVAKKEKEQLLILDFCISCRALGRKLEKIMLYKSIALLKDKLNTKQTLLYYKQGERNLPFIDFLQSLNIKIESNFAIIFDEKISYEGLEIESTI